MKFTSTKHASYSRSVACEEKTELKYEKQYLYNETTEHPMRGHRSGRVFADEFSLTAQAFPAQRAPDALARDERKWYLEQVLCRGWSKTQLLNTIRSGIDSTEHLEQFDSAREAGRSGCSGKSRFHRRSYAGYPYER
ncbi:MAG: hypothetical protein ACLU38_07400 [Dysosmobacter sp.]